MIVEGRKLQATWLAELGEKRKLINAPITLGILYQGDNPAMMQFLSLKKTMAMKLDIEVVERELSRDATTEEVITALKNLEQEVDGVIVQLPLLPHIDSGAVREALSYEKDIDVLSPKRIQEIGGEGTLLSPVVSSIKRILTTHNISIKGKVVVVVGEGILVGLPAKIWFEAGGALVTAITKESKDTEEKIAHADILVLGAGVGHLITPTMIKEGVVLLDAGTSEMHGVLVGDADPLCESKASLFTPVPGGIGPLTLTALFENLLITVEQK